MKAYSFRLGAVLRVRRVETLLARQRVGAVSRDLGRAVVREAEISATYENGTRASGCLDGAAFLANYERGGRLAGMLVSAGEVRSDLETCLGSERLRAVLAERKVAVLERLDERRRLEWLAAVQHEDVAVLDDFATGRAAAGAMAATRHD
jgi:hypothetical protein